MALIAITALLGLVIGSQLTTVVMRLPYEQSLARPPHCPVCETRLTLIDQLPLISWFRARGRCRYCHTGLGWRYPALELITAIGFAVITWRVGAAPALPAYLAFIALGVCLAAIDIDVHRLPDILTLPAYAALGGLFAMACTVTGDWAALGRAVACALAAFAIYYLLALSIPAGMGFGDVKFAGVVGMVLGYAGWSTAVAGIVFGFLLGGVLSTVLLVFGWVKRDTRIAFGPFMFAGACIALLLGGGWVGNTLGVTLG